MMNALFLAAGTGLASNAGYIQCSNNPSPAARASKVALRQTIEKAVKATSAKVRVAVHGDIVTLYGFADTQGGQAAELVAMADPRTNRVVNLITIS